MVCHQTYTTEDKKWLFPKEVIKENNKFFHADTKNRCLLEEQKK